MISLSGTFYNGLDSQGQPGYIHLHSADSVELITTSSSILLPTADMQVENRLGNTPRRISWGERSSFITMDNAAADELAKALPAKHAAQWVAWLEDKMLVVALSVVLALGTAIGFAVWGVPHIAEIVAFSAPQRISDELGQSTLTSLDLILDESELSAERRAALDDYFQNFGDITMTFRKAGKLGANALTLSATTIVFTDELVALSDHDEELLAVYLHELGHARLHHVERNILQNSAWLALLAFITGDFGGAAELFLAIPLTAGQMAYSRKFERAADAYAVAMLNNAGITPDRLATILEKLEASHEPRRHKASVVRDGANVEGTKQDGVPEDQQADQDRDWARNLFEYFSTHPATQERVAIIRENL